MGARQESGGGDLRVGSSLPRRADSGPHPGQEPPCGARARERRDRCRGSRGCQASEAGGSCGDGAAARVPGIGAVSHLCSMRGGAVSHLRARTDARRNPVGRDAAGGIRRVFDRSREPAVQDSRFREFRGCRAHRCPCGGGPCSGCWSVEARRYRDRLGVRRHRNRSHPVSQGVGCDHGLRDGKSTHSRPKRPRPPERTTSSSWNPASMPWRRYGG